MKRNTSILQTSKHAINLNDDRFQKSRPLCVRSTLCLSVHLQAQSHVVSPQPRGLPTFRPRTAVRALRSAGSRPGSLHVELRPTLRLTPDQKMMPGVGRTQLCFCLRRDFSPIFLDHDSLLRYFIRNHHLSFQRGTFKICFPDTRHLVHTHDHRC